MIEEYNVLIHSAIRMVVDGKVIYEGIFVDNKIADIK